MRVTWKIVCAEAALSRIGAALEGRPLQIAPYWKDQSVLEVQCAYQEDPQRQADPETLCRKIGGQQPVSVTSGEDWMEYACWGSLEEIRNGEQAFAVCFVNIKENEE